MVTIQLIVHLQNVKPVFFLLFNQLPPLLFSGFAVSLKLAGIGNKEHCCSRLFAKKFFFFGQHPEAHIFIQFIFSIIGREIEKSFIDMNNLSDLVTREINEASTHDAKITAGKLIAVMADHG